VICAAMAPARRPAVGQSPKNKNLISFEFSDFVRSISYYGKRVK
jgi:hypothetical protein